MKLDFASEISVADRLIKWLHLILVRMTRPSNQREARGYDRYRAFELNYQVEQEHRRAPDRWWP